MAAPNRPYYKYNLTRMPSGSRRGALSAVGKMKHAWRQNLPKFALAQLNPFDPNARGCKVPDNNTADSDTFQVQDETPLSTGVSGNAVVKAFQCIEKAYYVAGTGLSASSWSFPASWGGGVAAGQDAAIDADYQLYRPVAHGLRITTSMSALNAAGYLHICLYSGSMRGTSWNYPETISQMSECPQYKRVAISSLINSPLYVINKYLDPSAHIYKDITYAPTQASDNEFMTAFGWCTIIVAVTGAPASVDAVNIENLMHCEGTLRKTRYRESSAPEQPDPVLYSAVASAVAQQDAIVQGGLNLTRATGQVAEFVDNMANAVENSAVGQAIVANLPMQGILRPIRAGIRTLADISRRGRPNRRNAQSRAIVAYRRNTVARARLGGPYPPLPAPDAEGL